MKKTKTGLHIQTRKNRIEVYTEKELKEKEEQRKQARQFVINAAIITFASLNFFVFLLCTSMKVCAAKTSGSNIAV